MRLRREREKERGELVFACRSGHTCRPDVDGFPVSGVFDDFESDIARRAGEGGKFLIGRVEELFCDEESTERERETMFGWSRPLRRSMMLVLFSEKAHVVVAVLCESKEHGKTIQGGRGKA